MRVLKIHDLPENPMDSATPIAGWTGGPVSRTRQAIIGDGQSENFRCNVVNFREGATTGWHTHDCDQILVVTSGRGMVATEKEEREITVGDVVHIKAGERHWHGAKADSPRGGRFRLSRRRARERQRRSARAARALGANRGRNAACAVASDRKAAG